MSITLLGQRDDYRPKDRISVSDTNHSSPSNDKIIEDIEHWLGRTEEQLVVGISEGNGEGKLG